MFFWCFLQLSPAFSSFLQLSPAVQDHSLIKAEIGSPRDPEHHWCLYFFSQFTQNSPAFLFVFSRMQHSSHFLPIFLSPHQHPLSWSRLFKLPVLQHFFADTLFHPVFFLTFVGLLIDLGEFLFPLTSLPCMYQCTLLNLQWSRF